MPPRTRNNIGYTSYDLVEKFIACTNTNCPLHTKVLVPANFDFSQPFTSCFCCASNQLKHSKSYSSEAVTDSSKNELQTRATLFAEFQQEQSSKDAKRLNLIVKGTKPYKNCVGYVIVEKIGNQIAVSLVSSDVQCKWIGKPQLDTGNQLLLLKFKEMIKRNQFLRKSVALRDCENFDNVYVSPDSTKAERVQQYNLRLQNRQLESQIPANIYKNHCSRVQQQNWLKANYSTQISILLLNVQSILSIERRLYFCQPLSLVLTAVVCLTETWLDDSVSDNGVFAGQPYTVVLGSNHTAGHHGRLLVAMNNGFLGTFSLIYYSKCEHFCVLVSINQSLTLCIILAYLAPPGPVFYVKPGVTEDKLRSVFADVRQPKLWSTQICPVDSTWWF